MAEQQPITIDGMIDALAKEVGRQAEQRAREEMLAKVKGLLIGTPAPIPEPQPVAPPPAPKVEAPPEPPPEPKVTVTTVSLQPDQAVTDYLKKRAENNKNEKKKGFGFHLVRIRQ